MCEEISQVFTSSSIEIFQGIIVPFIFLLAHVFLTLISILWEYARFLSDDRLLFFKLQRWGLLPSRCIADDNLLVSRNVKSSSFSCLNILTNHMQCLCISWRPCGYSLLKIFSCLHPTFFFVSCHIPESHTVFFPDIL